MLVDASGLIAMARIGQADLLPELVGPLHTTPTVLSEATEPDEPGAHRIEELVDRGDLALVEAPHADTGTDATEQLAALGLGPGEASLIAACKPRDTLVLDDANARRVAQARGLPFTGLLGLLVAAVDRGRLSPARGLAIVRALARSDFRMTVELYDWAREEMEP